MAQLSGFSGKKALFDAEVYPNYISLKFEDITTGVISRFRITPDQSEHQAAEAHYRRQSVVVAYNSHSYDDHILAAAFKGLDSETIYEIGDGIINSGGRRYSPFLDRGGR
jgi:hypothetical protein